MGKLTELKCRNAKWAGGMTREGRPRSGAIRLSDGGGLYLVIKPSGAKSWLLSVQQGGVRRYIGLGGYDADLSLAEARDAAHRLRKLARQGLDPVAERDRAKVTVPTFAKAMEAAHAELSKGWAEKTAEGFKASLEEHALPKLGNRRVDQIEAEQVIAALSPIWTTKPQIARKVRQRIMTVLSFSKSRGWRTERVPDAREISNGLAKQPVSESHPAVPYKQVPALVAGEIAKDDSPARLALLFTILTAARQGEVRQAEWCEIDFEERLWHRPAEHMKSRKAHDVPLSDAALAILKRAEALRDKSGLIFPNSKGKPLSDAAVGKMLRLAGSDKTVHGFRSSFRDWAFEQIQSIPFEVAEMALAHEVGGKTVRSYLRSDSRDQRRALMAAWGQFIAPHLTSDSGNVTPITAASAA
jgi:integrase